MELNNTTLAEGLRNIHRVITRAIHLDLMRGAELLDSGFRTEQEMLGYVRFNRCLMAILSSHRQAEELVAYPAYRKYLPIAPYAQFTGEHHELESLCALIPEMMTDISSGNPNYGLRVLLILLRKLSRSWSGHIQVEEGYFCDALITPAMDAAIQGEIDEILSTLRMHRRRTGYWVVPFLLYEVEPLDLSSIGANFRRILTDNPAEKEAVSARYLNHTYAIN